MKAEEKLIQELAENGTELSMELFLEVQDNYGKKLNTVIGLIQALAVGNVHVLGMAETKRICEEAESLKYVKK